MTRIIPSKYLILTTFFLLSVSYTFAQKFEYKLIDRSTRNPVAFANITYGNKIDGVVSNLEGLFLIDKLKVADKIYISAVGFRDTTIFISDIQDQKEILLTPVVYEIPEAIILPGENPANRIIEQVYLNRKINNPEMLNSFSYISYNKMIYKIRGYENIEPEKSDSTIYSDPFEMFMSRNHLLIFESATEKKYRFPNKNKETVLAYKASGLSDPLLTMIGTQMQSFSIYNKYFELFDKKYLSPINKESHKKYFFLLTDTLKYNERDTIYVITFHPRKGKNFDGLKGFMHINTSKYAIQNIVAEPTTQDNSEMKASFQQKYEKPDGIHWFPVQLNSNLEYDDIIAEGKTYFKDIFINPGFPEGTFDGPVLTFDKDADIMSENRLQQYRHAPLTTKDTMTYHVIDSIVKNNKLANIVNYLEPLMAGQIPWGVFNIDLMSIIDYNVSEGFRLGLGLETNRKFSKHFFLGGYYAYGLKDKKSKYGGSVSVLPMADESVKINLSYKNDVAEIGGYSFLMEPDLASSEFYRQYMLQNLDHHEAYRLSVSFRLLKYLKSGIYIQNSTITSLDNYSYQLNPSQAINSYNVTEAGIKLRLAYGEEWMKTPASEYSLGTDYPVVYINYLQGINDWGGNFEYSKIEMRISDVIKIFSTHDTKITIIGGKLFGDVPLSLLYNGHGSYQSFSLESENSFGTMRMNEFYSSEFLYLFTKQYLGSIFSNKEWSPSFILINNYGIGQLSNQRKHNFSEIPLTMEEGFFETGILVNNLLSQSFIKYGLGIFYRYGPYAFPAFEDNFAYKITLVFAI